jgi:hypothetical protein
VKKCSSIDATEDADNIEQLFLISRGVANCCCLDDSSKITGDRDDAFSLK